MKLHYIVLSRFKMLLLYKRLLTAVLLSILALGVFTWSAKADNWTGAAQAVASQTRDWINPGNWSLNAVPPGTDINSFNFLGEGTIQLRGPQSAGAMLFSDFTYTNIASGPIPSTLTMVNSPAGSSDIRMGEGVRDTYGVDYFTAGPQFSADIQFSTLNVSLGIPAGGGGADSSMLISGRLIPNAGVAPVLNFQGQGNDASLWIASTNNWATGGSVNISSPGAAAAFHTYALHLTDSARIDGAAITLNDYFSALGLHDNTLGGANMYANQVITYGGNIFTDRSYQLNDTDSTINAVERIDTVFARYSANGVGANFGSLGTFGRTNNGYSLLVDTFVMTAMEIGYVGVHNGNLTEDRGGSRFVSGANRLQEAHNYISVDNFILPTTTPLSKFGKGVLWINQLNANDPLYPNVWQNTPMVQEGVLRLGSPTVSHSFAANQFVQLTADSALGIGWNTSVDLSVVPQVPFKIMPGAGIPGQSGALNIDLWNHSGTINTNIGLMPAPNYLRVASSRGGDASFDTQPLMSKHASTTATIIPYVNVKPFGDIEGIYYLGGGGGTLRIDSNLNDYMFEQQLLPCSVEMGTTGTLLPGRVALYPGGGPQGEPNTYIGMTDIRAGTLQFMNSGAVYGTSMVLLRTYNDAILNGLYDYNPPNTTPYTWKGPGMLLIDPAMDGTENLTGYQTNSGAGNLTTSLQLNGGVIGWTGNVNISNIPGQYGATLVSDLNPTASSNVYVLGLGGEYSAGTMTMQFGPGDDNNQGVITPVLLYKAGKNSTLDMRSVPGGSMYTGGTIIAGGTVIIDNPAQLNAGEGGTGGPIAILNGGRLRAAKPTLGPPDLYLNVPLKINTAGTPNTTENCGSVIEVDSGVQLVMMQPFDFSWNPNAYLEKVGTGTLNYQPVMPNAGAANAWGLKLTDGLVIVNQLPVNSNTDSGPVIFNNGDLEVTPVAPGTLDTDPAYGFRNIVSMQTTSSIVTVDDNAMFRTHGSVPNEILGTVNFVGSGDASSANNVVHLSRNMAPAPVNMPGDLSRGNGAMSFTGVTVYMSGDNGGPLNVLPQEAGFILQLNDGVVFNASHQNNVCGEVNFNNTNPATPVQIDGEEANPVFPISGPPYLFSMMMDTWTIYGTGYTAWAGTIEKIGPGTVAIKRSFGAPVAVNANTLLKISGGTFEAGGSADPFTDTVTNVSLDIQNDSTAPGLLISDGIKVADYVTGIGDTTINGPAGTELIVKSIIQHKLTVSSGCILKLIASPSGPPASEPDLAAVPEPATWILLVIAGLGIWIRRFRARL